MNEQEFHATVDKLFLAIENWLEKVDSEIDFETEQGILTLTFPDLSRLILSRQASQQEVWLASKQGAYHFRVTPTGWMTSQGETLLALLAQHLTPWSPATRQLTASDLI